MPRMNSREPQPEGEAQTAASPHGSNVGTEGKPVASTGFPADASPPGADDAQSRASAAAIDRAMPLWRTTINHYAIALREWMRRRFSYIALAVAGLIATALTFRGPLLLFSDDTFFPLDLAIGLTRNSVSWYSGYSASPNLVVVLSPSFLIYEGTGSLALSEAALLFAFFVTSSVGAAFLCRTLTGRRSGFSEIVIGLFYTYNYYTISFVWTSFKLWSVFYAIAPIVIALYIIALRREKFGQGLPLVALAMGIAGLAGVFPVPILMISLLFLSLAFVGKVSAQRLTCLFVAAVLLYACINLYEIVPTLNSLSTALSQHSAQEPSSLFYDYPLAQNPLNSIRLLGYEFIWYWGWGVPNYSWSSVTLSNPILVAMSFSPFLLGVYGLLVRDVRTRNVRVTSFLLLILGVTIGSAGGSFLGPGVYWVLSSTRLSQVYEIPFESFGILIVIGYIPLIYIALLDIDWRLCRVSFPSLSQFLRWVQDSFRILLPRSSSTRPFLRKRRVKGYQSRMTPFEGLIALLLVSGLLVSSFPVWTGQLSPGELARGQGQTPVPSSHVSVPSDYESFSSFASSLDHRFSLLVLPPYSPAPHTWQPQNETASDPAIEYYVGGLTVADLDSLGSSPLISVVNAMIVNNASVNTFLSVLGHLSVRYLLIEDDWLNEGKLTRQRRQSMSRSAI